MSAAPTSAGVLDKPILIAGGGIGGLAAALALSRRGVASHVLERRAAFGEDGAGVQLGPNATRVLHAIGAAKHLAPLVGVPQAIRVHDGSSGRLIATLPLGAWIAERHGSPYWVAHRRDVHDALRLAAEQERLISIETDAAVTDCTEIEGGVRVTLPTGVTRDGTALIGANGLWSSIRPMIAGPVRPAYSGKRAIRAVVPAASLPDGAIREATTVWLSSDAHVVHYPVRGGSEIAVVAILDEPVASKDWSVPVSLDDILLRIAGFTPPVRALFEVGEAWRGWSLHTLPALPSWTRGRIALLGDAAHPMLPFLAQGGAMALEDAVVLADEIAGLDAGSNVASALQRYADRRQARVAAVQSASVSNGRIFHLSGAMGHARNLTLGMVPGTRLMARYDWLYGWRAEG